MSCWSVESRRGLKLLVTSHLLQTSFLQLVIPPITRIVLRSSNRFRLFLLEPSRKKLTSRRHWSFRRYSFFPLLLFKSKWGDFFRWNFDRPPFFDIIVFTVPPFHIKFSSASSSPPPNWPLVWVSPSHISLLRVFFFTDSFSRSQFSFLAVLSVGLSKLKLLGILFDTHLLKFEVQVL